MNSSLIANDSPAQILFPIPKGTNWLIFFVSRFVQLKKQLNRNIACKCKTFSEFCKREKARHPPPHLISDINTFKPVLSAQPNSLFK